MFVQRGAFPIAHDACVRARVCVLSLLSYLNGSWPFQIDRNQAHTPSRPIFKHAQHTHSAPKRLPLGAEGVCSKAPKCKLPTRQNHHHHNLLLQLLLKVFVVARVYFKRRNSDAAEIGAEGMLGFYNTAMKNLATHACPHACP